MQTFKSFIVEEILLEELENLLNEAKDDASKVGGASNNTKGVLHELLVGHHLQNGTHMASHHLVDEKTGKKHSPEEAHDILKSRIHPEDYKKINSRAKSAAEHIKHNIIDTKYEIVHVHHTSKPGDTEKETGIPASQRHDSSDVYVTTKHKKTGKIKKYGISLKVSDKSSSKVPSSNLGMNSAGEKAHSLFTEHQKKIKAKYPELAHMKANKEAGHETAAESRKDWARKNPEKHNDIKSENRKLLANVAHHHAAELQHHLDSGNHEHVINHIRDVLAAKHTPAEQAGKATFNKHTTYVTAKGTQHSISHPGTAHEHILKDHKNIKVKAIGGSVHFYHTHPETGVEKKFASQGHKFSSQSDPLSTIVSSGKEA